MLKVYSENKTNRLAYAIDLVLRQVGELDYEWVNEKSQITTGDLVINYSGKQIDGAFQIHPQGLLFEKDIQNHDVPFNYRSDDYLVEVFPTEFDDLGFDIFSASFFIASRYEEYRNFELDEHGRFQGKDSLQKKIGILKRPIINIWVNALLNQLSKKWNVVMTNKRQFQIINTIDIDVAFAYKAKGGMRTVGGISKEIFKGNFEDASLRVKTLKNKQKDPFDTYEYIEEQVKKNGVESIFFLLLGDYKKPFDTPNDWGSIEYRKMVEYVSSFSGLGIHPSYESYGNSDKLKKEVERLRALANPDKILCRKHFLRIGIPDSYRLMEQQGIAEDYTMGFADLTGFRAGLCTPFYLFDVIADRQLSVLIRPFAYMDGTLCQYMKLTQDEAEKEVSFLKDEVRKVNGHFIGIWHNSTLTDEGEWKGWRGVYELGLK